MKDTQEKLLRKETFIPKSFQNLIFFFSLSRKKCSTNCQHNVYLIGNVVGNKVGGSDRSGCECSSKRRSRMTSLKYLRS